MYCFELHNKIHQIIDLFYGIGIWHRGDEATVNETRMKLFYSIYFLLFPLSMIIGATESDNKDESIFLIESAIIGVVISTKLFYIIWKKKQILTLLNQIGVHVVKDRDEFVLIKDNINSFMNLVIVFICMSVLTAIFGVLVLPFVGSERKLLLDIAFPLDWKNNEMAYWMAFTFVVTESFLAGVSNLFTVLVSYLMINCAVKYKVLGHQLKNMGIIRTVDEDGNKIKLSEAYKQNLFYKDLIFGIQSHEETYNSTEQLKEFLSTLFLIQIITSGLCICGSIYCLAIRIHVDPLEYLIYLGYLLYNFFDIFMVMYLGNEIQLESDSLSFCLFESNWLDQTPSCKRCIIILFERLKQPHELVIGKLYPLTLDTFTRILRGAYNMFNILKNLR